MVQAAPGGPVLAVYKRLLNRALSRAGITGPDDARKFSGRSRVPAPAFAVAAVSTEMTARSVTMTVSELELHAYIDGQLLEEERERIAAAVVASQLLAEEVGVMHELKELIRFVYGSERLPRHDRVS